MRRMIWMWGGFMAFFLLTGLFVKAPWVDRGFWGSMICLQVWLAADHVANRWQARPSLEVSVREPCEHGFFEAHLGQCRPRRSVKPPAKGEGAP